MSDPLPDADARAGGNTGRVTGSNTTGADRVGIKRDDMWDRPRVLTPS